MSSGPFLLVTCVSMVAAACGGGGREAADPTPPTADRAITTQSSTPAPARPRANAGPRSVAATSIVVEVDRFPRPADEACAGATTVVDVGLGDSITAALATAPENAVLNLAAGTYTERPDEWVALEIDANDICLRAVNGPAVLEAADDQTAGIIVTGDDVVIDGLVLRGFEVGMAIDGRTGETQRGLTIENSRIEDPAGEFREGIVVFAEPTGDEAVLDGLLVRNVVIEGADLGLSCNVGPCHHVWVEGSSISGRRASEDSGADALAVEEGRQIVIMDTVVAEVAADGIDTKANDVVVIGSRVLDVGRNGIKLWRGGDVINTVVDGTGADASLVGEEPGVYRYLHTLIAHHGDPGETPYVGTWSYDTNASGLTVEIVNSIFYENSPGGLYVPSDTSLSIRNSIFTGTSDDRLVQFGGADAFLFGDIAAFESAGFGTGNLMADPSFVDPVGGDYGTTSDSPARDGGEVIPGIDVDALGRTRGSTPDIGPTES